jgi:hypothetical protein
MNRNGRIRTVATGLSLCMTLLLIGNSASGQVSPAEILNPKLKAAEANYLSQLQSVAHAIRQAKFPFPFLLARYVGADPAHQAGFDSRGLEFVYFQNRILLKISGIYNAAYNSDQLTQNERASRTFQEVVAPILPLVTKEFTEAVKCDGIGFEIAYHSRTPNKSYDYEGREILAVVFNRDDAFAYVNATGEEQRQALLNQSEIYVNGKEFGLALGERAPLDLEALGRSIPGQPSAPVVSPETAASAVARLSAVNPRLAPTAPAGRLGGIPGAAAPSTNGPVPAAVAVTPDSVASSSPAIEPRPIPTPADAERLQSQFQTQLDALVKDNAATFHLVEYAPPSFAVYHHQVVLQFTMRNPQLFEKTSSSIYKRAAQSFDLFLAPRLKPLIKNLPAGAEFDALDFTVLNQLGAEKNSSEAVEFVCPLKASRSFVEDEITSQDLINQGVVLVNGVRIALNLQLVE